VVYLTNFPKGRVAFFVTGNNHKFNEARRVLSEYRIATAMLRKIDATEIQDDSIENVAKASVIDAVKKCDLPVLVEDAGLFIEALKSFPGPYSSYVYRTIGNEGVLRLMEDVANRRACFNSVVAFLSPSKSDPLFFNGEVEGQITAETCGSQGFGFDPIFKPSGSSKTFAEMSVEEKNKHSHRALAFRRFAEWYTASF
jgi:XTP/dITP diphosphohydrolase